MATTLAPDRATSIKHAPRYKVILHNDDHNSMEHVHTALVKIFPNMTPERAYEIMMTAHTEGKALVGTYAQEHAEHYQAQLLERGLTATIEAE